jgi:hypothetical protein
MPERPQAGGDKPDIYDLQEVLLGLQGIFWALAMLRDRHVADLVEDTTELDSGIANLIQAGECLTQQVTRRF